MEYEQIPVGSYKPNAFGLYDMHGNVFEWCIDGFDPDFYSRADAGRRDPVADSSTGFRMTRGGGWNADWRFCRSAGRFECPATNASDSLGFRPAYYPVP